MAGEEAAAHFAPVCVQKCCCMSLFGSTQLQASAQCALEVPQLLPPKLEAYCSSCVPVAIGDKL